MEWRNKWFLLAVVALVGSAWMYRFQVSEFKAGRYPGSSYAVVLDRWTGEVKVTGESATFSVGYAWRATEPTTTAAR